MQDALRFAMDVIIGGKYNSAKKDNDFIYHEAILALDTLQPVKGLKQRGREASVMVGDEGTPLVKPLPVNPTDIAVTCPDIFAKLVTMAVHEASSLYRWAVGASSSLGQVGLAGLGTQASHNRCVPSVQ
ncbi:hypothetical protein MC885_017128 [Smutsia gigantea]|nr:hypothetical protein MC885_017128 [Smutsia gigantea]